MLGGGGDGHLGWLGKVSFFVVVVSSCRVVVSLSGGTDGSGGRGRGRREGGERAGGGRGGWVCVGVCVCVGGGLKAQITLNINVQRCCLVFLFDVVIDTYFKCRAH